MYLMHKIELERFSEVNKHLWTPEAINYCVVYIRCWTKAKFLLVFSENKVVIFFRSALFWGTTQRVAGQPIGPVFKDPSKFTDPLKSIRGTPRGPRGSADPSLRTAGLDEQLLTYEGIRSIYLI
jgi:hypothetical protein